jgi:hypothetical protein
MMVCSKQEKVALDIIVHSLAYFLVKNTLHQKINADLAGKVADM